MKFFLLGVAFAIGGFYGHAQKHFIITGTVSDADTERPLANVLVKLSHKSYKTNTLGVFVIDHLPDSAHTLEFGLSGYDGQTRVIQLRGSDKEVRIFLEKSAVKISEVEIFQKSKRVLSQESSSVNYELTKDFLDDHRENTLMQSLQNLPGIQAMGIGVGQSKPSIRGLGFNRVVVSQYGIKHEAQQWGSDHGLEIDQNGVGGAQIIKGPASIIYGSDAIGGVIDLRPLPSLVRDSLAGTANLLAESNNNLMAANVGLRAKKGDWYYSGQLTYNDYGDFKVPVDKIIYENYIFGLHNNDLRNTAGRERNASFSIGFTGNKFKTETFVSNVNSKNGFFANAHGLEVRTSEINYDMSSRDIDLPYHTVNHLKIANNSSWSLDRHQIKLNVGFQNNVREEHSEPVAHGYMPVPKGTLDRRYVKSTYSIELLDEVKLSARHILIFGVGSEYQHNEIDGWGFLIPAYYKTGTGMYIYDKYEVSKNLFLHAGLRYDAGTIHTKAYSDWYPSVTATETTYLQRAANSRLAFNNISAAAGISYVRSNTNYKINIGKGFRMPLANELSSDGVNYHMFRYERGNMNLKPETSYQLDAEFSLNTKKINFSISPFINFFENYIYLNPTAGYYETLQIYEYTQSKVLRWGGELSVEYHPTEKLAIEASAEYVHSRQKSGAKKNFTLPFSPPLRTLISTKYSLGQLWYFEDIRFRTDFHLAAKQSDIVPPENTTEGYHAVDISLTAGINIFSEKNKNPKLRLKLNNVFNKVYFDHMSYYRIIGIPQPGRNASVSLTIPF